MIQHINISTKLKLNLIEDHKCALWLRIHTNYSHIHNKFIINPTLIRLITMASKLVDVTNAMDTTSMVETTHDVMGRPSPTWQSSPTSATKKSTSKAEMLAKTSKIVCALIEQVAGGSTARILWRWNSSNWDWKLVPLAQGEEFECAKTSFANEKKTIAQHMKNLECWQRSLKISLKYISKLDE